MGERVTEVTEVTLQKLIRGTVSQSPGPPGD